MGDRYKPTHRRGKRVPGWEDTNISLLAADMGVTFRYLLPVLTGQRNCTLSILQSAAHTLGITLVELITRMERAHALRIVAAANLPNKAERRRARSERRALQPQG